MEKPQREYVIRDLVNWYIELKVTGGGEGLTNEDINNKEEEYRELDNDTLKRVWKGNVGEWVNSMQRWFPEEYEKRGYDNPGEWQFNKLINEGDVDYGYLNYKYELPYRKYI